MVGQLGRGWLPTQGSAVQSPRGLFILSVCQSHSLGSSLQLVGSHACCLGYLTSEFFSQPAFCTGRSFYSAVFTCCSDMLFLSLLYCFSTYLKIFTTHSQASLSREVPYIIRLYCTSFSAYCLHVAWRVVFIFLIFGCRAFLIYHIMSALCFYPNWVTQFSACTVAVRPAYAIQLQSSAHRRTFSGRTGQAKLLFYTGCVL